MNRFISMETDFCTINNWKAAIFLNDILFAIDMMILYLQRDGIKN